MRYVIRYADETYQGGSAYRTWVGKVKQLKDARIYTTKSNASNSVRELHTKCTGYNTYIKNIPEHEIVPVEIVPIGKPSL